MLVKRSLKVIIIISVVIVLGVSLYFAYNWFKTYSFIQKVDSLIGQYSMTKVDRPFKEVLREWGGEIKRVYSFEEFKAELARVNQKRPFMFSLCYNINERVIYFQAHVIEWENFSASIKAYMVYYIEE